MYTLHQTRYDSKYAAVTFSTTATVNFKFLPNSLAASKLTRIPYPDGSTNTQAGLAEAKKLFDDPNSGTLFIRIWAVKTYACIVQSLNTDEARDRKKKRGWLDNPLLRTKSRSRRKLYFFLEMTLAITGSRIRNYGPPLVVPKWQMFWLHKADTTVWCLSYTFPKTSGFFFFSNQFFFFVCKIVLTSQTLSTLFIAYSRHLLSHTPLWQTLIKRRPRACPPIAQYNESWL